MTSQHNIQMVKIIRIEWPSVFEFGWYMVSPPHYVHSSLCLTLNSTELHHNTQ